MCVIVWWVEVAWARARAVVGVVGGVANDSGTGIKLTSFMNFLHTGRISLDSVAENIITCLSCGVILKISCTSARMSARSGERGKLGSQIIISRSGGQRAERGEGRGAGKEERGEERREGRGERRGEDRGEERERGEMGGE